MIKSIEIKNFKSIKKKLFPLRNLNLLFGLNGMGKSTFIQSILLLRQSNLSENGELRLNGEYINIGNTKDALYQYCKDDEMRFIINFTNEDSFCLNFSYKMDSDIFKIINRVIDDEDSLKDIYGHTVLGTNFQYLCANRLGPQSIHTKNYSNVVNLNNIGMYGEFIAHFIDVHGNEDIHFDNLLHKNSIIRDNITGKELINKKLINQINLWMGEISPGINIKTTSIPNSNNVLLDYSFRQPNYGDTNRYKPINVGFGISYALPIVTTLLASRPDELIIIENPESHIHPRGQAELGKLIALTALNDIQIIVETHSDHILNGIRVAVKEENNKKLKDKIILFYFDKIIEDSEQYSKITDIEIDKNGTLSKYPENLLDEWSNQLSKLI